LKKSKRRMNMKFEEIEKLCEMDDNGRFKRLVIPANEPNSLEGNEMELNCIGLSWKDLKLNEVIRVKCYISKLGSM